MDSRLTKMPPDGAKTRVSRKLRINPTCGAHRLIAARRSDRSRPIIREPDLACDPMSSTQHVGCQKAARPLSWICCARSAVPTRAGVAEGPGTASQRGHGGIRAVPMWRRPALPKTGRRGTGLHLDEDFAVLDG